jgi:Flp pilus assembly protein TadG
MPATLHAGISARHQGGQATLELAFVLPIVAVVIAGLVETAMVAGDQLRLWHAAREAARVAVVDSDPSVAERTIAEQGFANAVVDVTPSVTGRLQGEPLTVSVGYRRPARVPVIGHLFNGLELRARATMRIEQP